jgi:TonB family protein
MTIRKNIAFSLLFHSLLFFVTVLSARYIVSGERIFFVELKDNPGAGQQLNEADRPRKVLDTRARKITQRDEAVVPPRDQKQEQRSDIKGRFEDHHPEPPVSQPVHEKAEEASASLQEKPGKAGYGDGETHPSPTAASSGETASGNSAGVTMIEMQSGSGGGNAQSIVGQIKASIERAKIYPVLARKRNQEGTVITEFSINAKGLPQNIQIIKSSGFSLLDSAARDTIVKASPFPVIRGTIEVPLTFLLKAE